MLLLVIGLVIFICVRYRAKGDPSEGAQTTGNKSLEALMIGVPILLLGWFFFQSVGTARAVAPASDNTRKPDVVITGHQWWWEVAYPGYGVITANEVHLPVGKHILMEMRSADVIHDWWVPELGNKTDLVPGNKTYLSVDIMRPGDYLGTCSEFCGAQHAWMRIRVVAQRPADFAVWLAANAKTALPPTDSLSREGAASFQAMTCASCHRIGGTPAVADAGPDLTHVGSRRELLTGILPTSEADLRSWISDPQRIKPGARMPDFILSRDSIAAIAHYLEQLK
jgi:cytochrome c oxidase subunit 2